jgi:predicted NUDIX family NTP pyrophosphohydrolase
MPPRVSAGLLMFRVQNGTLQVFLAHPGGPLYTRKDDGHWSIPKGEPPEGEALIDAAIREFEEETGIKPHGPYIELGWIRQKGGKVVHGWAFEGVRDDSQQICSNTFEMEWPPRSGRTQSFPEVDRAQFFPLAEAKQKLRDSQWPLIERLAAILENSAKDSGQL